MLNLKKAQSSTEFVILVAFMMFVFIFFFIIIQQKLISANEQKNDAAAQQVMNQIINEIRVAESVNDDYYRQFLMPNNVNGLPYNVSITQGIAQSTEIVIKYNDKENVYFLEQFISTSSTLGQGLNNISKSGGIITIQNMN